MYLIETRGLHKLYRSGYYTNVRIAVQHNVSDVTLPPSSHLIIFHMLQILLIDYVRINIAIERYF